LEWCHPWALYHVLPIVIDDGVEPAGGWTERQTTRWFRNRGIPGRRLPPWPGRRPWARSLGWRWPGSWPRRSPKLCHGGRSSSCSGSTNVNRDEPAYFGSIGGKNRLADGPPPAAYGHRRRARTGRRCRRFLGVRPPTLAWIFPDSPERTSSTSPANDGSWARPSGLELGRGAIYTLPGFYGPSGRRSRAEGGCSASPFDSPTGRRHGEGT